MAPQKKVRLHLRKFVRVFFLKGNCFLFDNIEELIKIKNVKAKWHLFCDSVLLVLYTESIM